MFEAILESRGLLVLSFLAAYLLYSAGVVIQRLYFSSLAKFPGPKLAAATYLYEGYYDGKSISKRLLPSHIVGRYRISIWSKHMSFVFGKHAAASYKLPDREL